MMKNMLVCLFALLLISPIMSYSADNYVVGKVGVFTPNDFSNGTEEFDNGPAIGVAAGRMVTKNLAVEVGIDYTRTDLDYPDWSNGVDPDIKVQTIGVPVVLKAFAPLNKEISLFFGAGAGVYYTDIDFYAWNPSDESTGYALGYLAVAGADYMVTDKIGLTGELKYTKVNQNSLSNPLDNIDLEFGGLTAAVGAKFKF